MRLITPALSWQLAAQIVAAYDGPMDEIIWTPQTVTAAVLELAGDLSEHLRDTGGRHRRGPVAHRGARCAAGADTGIRSEDNLYPARQGSSFLPLVSRYAAAKAAREVLDHGDQVALARADRQRAPGGRDGRACPLPGDPA